jgi:hypothetical protein
MLDRLILTQPISGNAIGAAAHWGLFAFDACPEQGRLLLGQGLYRLDQSLLATDSPDQ